MDMLFNRRARLGLTVNLRARDTDSIGAYVTSVTPGGPAGRAGIQSGDIITRLDGQSLLEASSRAMARGSESAPGRRLVELAVRLAPNDTIAIELRRGRTRKNVRLVTGDEPIVVWMPDSANAFAYRFDSGSGTPLGGLPLEGGTLQLRVDSLRREHPPWSMRGPEPGGRVFSFTFDSPLADLELAPLNMDLGRYFGTSDGVLVISAPADSRLGLRGGDVVLAVDGRAPANPAHLFRILRSYDEGEEFKLEIMRDHKRQVVTGQVMNGKP
jgi:S1-C subfamily serine protease